MAYIGNTNTTQQFIPGVSYYNGNGSTTAFTLGRTVGTVNDIEVYVENVRQRPDGYTVSGTTLTLSAAPPTGTSNVYVCYLSSNTVSLIPAQNSVVYSSLSSDMQGSIYGFKNRIINGAMTIDQRNAGASVTQSTTASTFSVDRWFGAVSQASKISLQQNTATPPNGFKNYIGITSLSSYSVLTGDYFVFQQNIEGFNTVDLAWGTAAAQTVTLSFWVRSSLTGTFGGFVKNNNGSRSYVVTYTISSQNTWEYKTITIPGDTTGTWLNDNSTGISVGFGLGAGSTYSATAGSWQGSNLVSASGAVSVVGTSGATWQVTGVQFEKGTTATAFDYRPITTELALCQRYYVHYSSATNAVSYFATGFGYTTGASISVFQFPVPMRTGPSLSTSGTASHYRWLNGGSFLTCSAVPSLDQTNPFTSDVIFTQSTTTVGFGGMIGANSTTAAYLGFSAEL
jgi:hypothetical protein